MEGYTDTVILECNRKSSPEYLSGNTTTNSTWMNTLGTGVTVDVGDTIQVESAYVSAIGNEASTIEIKGRTFEVSRSSSQIEINASFEGNAFVGETELTSDPVGTYRWNARMSKKEYYLKDNEINLTQSYYKNANAEYYMTLPRMAAVNGSFNDIWEPISTSGLTTINFSKNNEGMMANWYAYNSSLNGSVNKPNPFRLGTDYNAVSYDKPFLNLTDFTQEEYPVNASYYRNLGPRQECINDGSRHTLFVRDKFSNNASDKDDYPLSPLRDPALFNWIWYKDTNTYKVNVGFNSPQNVATQMTDQMSDITELERLNVMRTANNEKSMRVMNIQGETQSLKLFPCATPVNFYNQHVSGSISTSNSPAECYLNINSASLTANSMDSSTWDSYLYGYDANWTSVGFKRPELQETGRNMSVDVESKSFSFKIANYDSSASLQDQKIVYPSSSDTNAANGYKEILPLDLDWAPDNLKLLKDYFDAQGLYPELFNYAEMSASQQEYAFDITNYPNASSKINVNQSRYIHMNRHNLDINRVYFQIGTEVEAGDFVISTSDTLPTDMKLGDKMTSFSDPTLFNLDKGETFIVALDRTSTPNTITLSSSFATNFEADGTETFDFSQRILGNDNYFEATTNASTECAAVFFDYDSSRSEIASGGSFPTDLYYGFGIKYINKLKEEKIALSLKSFGLARGLFDGTAEINLGLSKTFYTTTDDPPVHLTRINYETTRELGFDKHFNAYGTCAILLYNGDANSNDPPYITATNTRKEGNASGVVISNTNLEQYPRSLQVWQEREEVEGYESGQLSGTVGAMLGPNCGANPYSAQAKYKNHVYIGADDPLFDFDGNQSRFFFQRLHTAERVGNLYNSDPTTEVSDADLIVYKINKRLRFTNYSPSFIPYNRNEVEAKLYDSNASALPVKMTPLDKNIVPFSIMDSHSGIQFEDYGVDQKNWRNSLWELLGFSYNQLHSSKANRTARVEARGLNSQFATTNAEILSADFMNYNLNQFGVVKYDPTQVAMSRWFCQDNSKTYPYTELDPNDSPLELGKSYYAGRWYGYADYPTIVQSCSSVKIVAENLPRKMLSPIYLIKSDVISPEYVGGPEGKSKLPIVAIVPKNSGYGDFYNGGEGTVFTNTIPRTIQNITTTIMDADGTEARVDDASCVLYKITKQIASTDQVIQDILNPKSK